jgi:dTDP-4-dehydrorhamnose reductase
MTLPERVAVTGASGRLGRALMAVLQASSMTPIAWSRPDYDLDHIDGGSALIARDAPAVVVHAAAWTDVDGCAREPALAQRRNAAAAGELAASARELGAHFVLVSTNEVFDGRRSNGGGYSENDLVNPINTYGASKLAGEAAVSAAYRGAEEDVAVVRTSWLFGEPGSDFPHKILAAAMRLPEGHPLRVVADEYGSPTYARDLAHGIVQLIAGHHSGTFHLVNSGHTSRAGWARRVLTTANVAAQIQPISQAEYPRASSPPLWGVLDASKAASIGVRLRAWADALDDYMAGATVSL